jgi:hypothetical protein
MAAKAPRIVHAEASFIAEGSLSIDATVLSAGEIAERIARSPEDIATVRERLRTWTQDRLLLPTGTLRPGSGRHRRYAAGALLDAAILNKLTDAGVRVSSDLLPALEQARQALARSAKGHWFLELIRDGSDHHAEVYRAKTPRLPAAGVAIIVDLARVFARLQSRAAA